MKKKSKALTKPIIGWREWVSLPDLGIKAIKVKADTGARTSALHALGLCFFKDHRGREWVRFRVHPLQRNTAKEVECEAEIIDWREIKDSGGHSTQRPVIMTCMQIGPFVFPIEITLTNRDLMGFRMLLGRQAVKDSFLINPGRSYMLGKQLPTPKKRRPSKSHGA